MTLECTLIFLIRTGYKKLRAQMAKKLRNFRAEFQETKETFPIDKNKKCDFLAVCYENRKI